MLHQLAVLLVHGRGHALLQRLLSGRLRLEQTRHLLSNRRATHTHTQDIHHKFGKSADGLVHPITWSLPRLIRSLHITLGTYRAEADDGWAGCGVVGVAAAAADDADGADGSGAAKTGTGGLDLGVGVARARRTIRGERWGVGGGRLARLAATACSAAALERGVAPARGWVGRGTERAGVSTGFERCVGVGVATALAALVAAGLEGVGVAPGLVG
jgi:hypothetical protein